MKDILYIKGTIKANYSAKEAKGHFAPNKVLYDIEKLHEPRISETTFIDKYHFKYLEPGSDFYRFDKIENAVIDYNGTLFTEDLLDVFIEDIITDANGKDGVNSYGTFTGTIYATIEREIKPTVQDLPEDVIKPTVETPKKTIVDKVKARSTSNNWSLGGCLGTLFKVASFIFLGFLILGLLSLLFKNIYQGISIIIGLLVIGLILYVLSKIFKFAFRSGWGWVLLLLLLGILAYNYSNKSTNYSDDRRRSGDDMDEKSEIIKDSTNVNGDSSYLVRHFRRWNDLGSKQYEGYITIRQKDYFSSKVNHNDCNYNLGYNFNQWGKMYDRLSSFDSDKLDYIYSLLDSIKTSNNLSYNKFAEVIVTMVQDIPYKLIVEEDCDVAASRDYNTRATADRFGCVGDVKYGVYSPVEFMYSLDGDCDTRSLLIFTVLAHYGYNVAVLVSFPYQHSILGIDLPGVGGSYVRGAGRKYYVWETTSKGFDVGYLPPENSNMSNWNIALTNN